MYTNTRNEILPVLFILCLPLSWAASAIGSIYRWITIALFGLYVVKNRVKIKIYRKSRPMLIAMSVLVAFVMLSIIWGRSASDGITSILSFVTMLLIALLFASDVYGEKTLDIKLDQSWIAVGIVSACLFIFGDRAQVGIYGSRTTLQILGTRTDPNEFAGIFAVPISVNIYHLFRERGNKKIINVFALMIEMYAVILSGSRGAMVSCAISTVTTLALCVRITLKNVIVSLIAITILVLVFAQYLLPLVPVDVLKRMSIQVLLNDGGGGRRAIWFSALDQYINGDALRMLFGYGANGLLAQGERGQTGAMHNYYLQVLTNYGLIGLGLYLNLLWMSLRKFWHCNRKYVAGLIAMAALSFTLTTSPNYKPLWILMMMAMIPEKNLIEMEERSK